MADPDSYPHPTSEAASAVMKANRKVDTEPEVRLRSALHRRGYRFRKNHLVRSGGVRVTPDVVFTKQRVAVFVDGCFWHRCPDHGTSPQSNSDYWRTKLDGNVERDRRVDAALREDGWTVVRIWEHAPVEQAVDEVVDAMGADGAAVVV